MGADISRAIRLLEALEGRLTALSWDIAHDHTKLARIEPRAFLDQLALDIRDIEDALALIHGASANGEGLKSQPQLPI